MMLVSSLKVMNGSRKPEASDPGLKKFSWKEVEQHTDISDRWIVIDNVVYDVTKWQNKHPGGARIIGHVAGQDATDAFEAMHKDRAWAVRILKGLAIGTVNPIIDGSGDAKSELLQDYRRLRTFLRANGFFQPSPIFYILHLCHIILLEIFACIILHWFGATWSSYMIAALLVTTSQAQAGWSQHDFGHLAVFSTSKRNRMFQRLIIECFKGASSHWWNFRHNQHHVKTNIVSKDPDISVPRLFILGNKQPVIWGQKRKRGILPFNWQHLYFWCIGPPAVVSVYFLFEILYFSAKRKDFLHFLFFGTYVFRLYLLYGSLLGTFGVFQFYFFTRSLESVWFMIVTQINHITMEVDKDSKLDWVTSQALTTCNLEPSFFNDWFTGHLNYQIEHHLFPMMPRHNYRKVQPYVKAMFKKHGLVYVEKSLLNGILDIHRCLRKSGQLWYDAYQKAKP